MKITVVGAASGEVTGSAYYVETQKAAVLIDCGQFQGSRKAEALNKPPKEARRKLDAVLITHGHLDHTGRLPLLAKRGHRVPVYATAATIELNWDDVSDAGSYKIEQAVGPNFDTWTASTPASSTESNVVVTGLTADTAYKFRVRAVIDGKDSDPSLDTGVVSTTA